MVMTDMCADMDYGVSCSGRVYAATRKLGQSLEQSGEYHNKSNLTLLPDVFTWTSLKRNVFVGFDFFILSLIIVENLLVINLFRVCNIVKYLLRLLVLGLALAPHSKRDQIPWEPQGFTCSPGVWVGSPQVPQLPPTAQRHAFGGEVNQWL